MNPRFICGPQFGHELPFPDDRFRELRIEGRLVRPSRYFDQTFAFRLLIYHRDVA